MPKEPTGKYTKLDQKVIEVIKDYMKSCSKDIRSISINLYEGDNGEDAINNEWTVSVTECSKHKTSGLVWCHYDLLAKIETMDADGITSKSIDFSKHFPIVKTIESGDLFNDKDSKD